MTTTDTQCTGTEYISGYFQMIQDNNRSHKLYGIIDAAQDAAIYPTISVPSVYKKCLYKKKIHFPGEWMSEELKAAAPYLISLSINDPLLLCLLEKGWGKNWCTFLFSDKDFNTVHEHCCGNILAQTEDGEMLQFRWFDPRILRVYLPSCTADELIMFYGPVTAFCAENKDGKEPVLFTLKNGELDSHLASGKLWTPQENPFDSLEGEDVETLDDIEEEKCGNGHSDSNLQEETPVVEGLFLTENYEKIIFETCMPNRGLWENGQR